MDNSDLAKYAVPASYSNPMAVQIEEKPKVELSEEELQQIKQAFELKDLELEQKQKEIELLKLRQQKIQQQNLIRNYIRPRPVRARMSYRRPPPNFAISNAIMNEPEHPVRPLPIPQPQSRNLVSKFQEVTHRLNSELNKHNPYGRFGGLEKVRLPHPKRKRK